MICDLCGKKLKALGDISLMGGFLQNIHLCRECTNKVDRRDILMVDMYLLDWEGDWERAHLIDIPAEVVGWPKTEPEISNERLGFYGETNATER